MDTVHRAGRVLPTRRRRRVNEGKTGGGGTSGHPAITFTDEPDRYYRRAQKQFRIVPGGGERRNAAAMKNPALLQFASVATLAFLLQACAAFDPSGTA
jgi:hypothetical protein